jgi:ubiquitin thioesterase protein OTUB1
MGDVKAYCANNIEPAQCEADNIGVAALADALVKPAGFGLEVWYLDRSPGEEINRSYYAEPTDPTHGGPIPHAPMLRLLYRPGHYDILYKAEDIPPPIHHQPVAPQPPLQVNFTNYADEFLPQASNFGDVMSMLPNMGRPSLGGWASLSYDCNPSPAPQPQVTPVQPFPSASMSAPPVTSSHLDFVAPIHSGQASQYNAPRHHSIQLDQPPITLPMHPAPPPAPPVSIERSTPLTVERGGPFRPSMYELEPGFGFSSQALPFQTSIFRNSHYNTAHYLNPEFQPEEWCPDGEYATGNKGRHKHPS